MARTKKIFIYLILYILTSLIILSTLFLTPNTKYNFPVLRNFIIFFASVLLFKYFVYMVLSPWYDLWKKVKNKKHKQSLGSYNPKVSVLVPVWNEEIGIISTIESIMNNSYNNIELVVVNDGSADSSDKLVKKYIENFYRYKDENNNNEILYKYKENGGKGSALNTALEISSGEIIISIDADCWVDKDAIKNFVKYFSDKEIMAAVGNVKIGNTKKIIGVVQYLEFLFSFYFKKAESVFNTIYIIGGAAGAFRREVFDKVGNYNTSNITEDIELSVRIQKAGMKIVYASDVLVKTEGAYDIKGLMSQRLRWKKGRFQTFYQHRDLFFGRNKKYNKLLSFIIMPLAIFGELQLFMELWFVLFLYVYSYLTSDFSSFISGILVVGSMFMVQVFFNQQEQVGLLEKISFCLLSPIAWMLFYLSTFVEFNALIKSIWSYLTKREVQWQKWERKGVFD